MRRWAGGGGKSGDWRRLLPAARLREPIDRLAKAGQKTVGVILLNPSIDVLAKWVVASWDTSTYSTQKKRIKVFIDEPRQSEIAVAGWGWCQEADAKGVFVHPHLPIALLGLDAAGIHRRSRLTTLSVSIIEGACEAPLPDTGLMSCCTGGFASCTPLQRLTQPHPRLQTDA
jgi:hypothetical protein